MQGYERADRQLLDAAALAGHLVEQRHTGQRLENTAPSE
jgi:hypothetical protein